MNMIKLYGKPMRVNKASAHQKNLDVGANIFIGNLDPEVDEKLLYDTFSAFGVILSTPKIMRDPESGNSKGYAFVNFASFEASDAAIEAMNGQYLCNRPITISYAFKKDSKGERHGSAAERLLAAQNPLAQADRPHQLFADAPPTVPGLGIAPPMNPIMGMMNGSGHLLPPPPAPFAHHPMYGFIPDPNHLMRIPDPNHLMQMQHQQMAAMGPWSGMGFPPPGFPPPPPPPGAPTQPIFPPPPPPPPPPTSGSAPPVNTTLILRPQTSSDLKVT